MIVALTLERYFTYCHPEKAKWLCTRTVAKILVILLTIFSLLCTIPVFMEHEWNSDGTVQQAGLRINPFYQKGIRAWMNSAIRFFIPTICLVIFNYRIIKEVMYHSRALKSRSKLKAAIGLRAAFGKFLLHPSKFKFMYCDL